MLYTCLHMAKIKKTTQPKKSVKKVVKKMIKKSVKKAVSKTPEIKSQLPIAQVQEKLAKTNLMPIAVLLVGVFILTALFLFARKTLIVATINGQPLTRFEVIRTLEKQSAKQTTDSLISQILLLQKAKIEKVEASSEDIQNEITKIEKQLKQQGNDLETILATQGMTRKDLEEQIMLRLLLDKLLANKIKVTDKEVNQYLNENRESYPEEMTDKELKKTIREQLENQKLSTAAQELLTKLKEEAKINYFINY